MLRIDNTLLQEIGLGGLPDAEKNSLLKHIYDTLEMRVGMRLADQMTNEQLDEFERYYENKDDAGAFKWLETNFPNYKDIVQEEFDKLKSEVAQSAPQILSASQQAAQSTPQQSGVAPQQQQPIPQPDPTSQVNPPMPQQPVQPSAVQSLPPADTPTVNPVPQPPVSPVAPPPSDPPQPPYSEPTSPPAFPSEQPPPGPGAA